MLEQLSEYVASECKRAVDVGGYLERIHIQYLELIKAKEALPVLHSRILPRVLGKLSEMLDQRGWTALNGRKLATRQVSGKLCTKRTRPCWIREDGLR